MIGATAQALLARLADGRFHSGERLARELGVSRAAVWKHLKSLRDTGLEFTSTAGRGYRLDGGLELLDGARIRSLLARSGWDGELELFPVIDSTNRRLMERAAGGAASGTVSLAEMQTAGRGRRGRQWVSPFGTNLYLSMLWRFEKGTSALGGLTLAVSVGAVRALGDLGVGGMTIKWPNDLYFEGRKFAGTLVEVSGESTGPCHAVIGMGMNLRMPGASRDRIDQPLAELSELPGGDSVGRNRLAAALIHRWQEILAGFADQGLAPYLEDFRAHDMTRGEPVTLLAADRQFAGTAVGVDDDGRLRVRLPEGERLFAGGEVSLRMDA